MRFALFTTNLAGGGAEKALATIGSGLAERGHDVDFIVCEDAGRYSPPAGCGFAALSAHAGHGWLGKRRLAWKLARVLRNRKHDLLVSTLPFADESFDDAVCCVSVDYLTRPVEVFAEVARVLRPGGRFLCLEFSRVVVPGLDRAARGECGWVSYGPGGPGAAALPAARKAKSRGVQPSSTLPMSSTRLLMFRPLA